MALSKDQVLAIRERADAVLRKYEEDETNDYKKLALGYTNLKSDVNRIIGMLGSDRESSKTMAALAELKKELGEAIKATTPDMSGVSKAIASLEVAVKSQKQDNSDVIKAIKSLKLDVPATKDRSDDIIKAIKAIKVEPSEVTLPDVLPVHIMGTEVVQKTPQPVTNININPLRGYIHTTAATVTGTVTPLPTYGVLDNRRAIIIFNNDENNTVYVGGSDVTATTGLPILAQSFSPR